MKKRKPLRAPHAPESRSQKRKRGPGRPFKKGRSGNPARQFKKGISGNPGGYSRAKLLSDASREWLAEVDEKTGLTNAVLVVRAMGKKLLQGSAQHYTAMADRTEGRPPQAITLGGEVQLTVAEIDARLDRLLRKVRSREKENAPTAGLLQ